EQVGRLLERVGAVRDNRPGDAFIGKLLSRRASQLHHPRRRDVRAGPSAEIDHVEIGYPVEPRNLRDDLFARKRGHRAARRGIEAHRDRAAGKECRKTMLHTSYSWKIRHSPFAADHYWPGKDGSSFDYGGLQMRVRDGKRYSTGSVSEREPLSIRLIIQSAPR